MKSIPGEIKRIFKESDFNVKYVSVHNEVDYDLYFQYTDFSEESCVDAFFNLSVVWEVDSYVKKYLSQTFSTFFCWIWDVCIYEWRLSVRMSFEGYFHDEGNKRYNLMDIEKELNGVWYSLLEF